jgi:chloride channel protein, CIC family
VLRTTVPDPFLNHSVSEFMTSDVKVVAASLPLCRLFDRYHGGESRDTLHSYPVVDEEGRLAGMITRWDLPKYSSRAELGWLVVADVMRPAPITSCHPGDSLRTAAERMSLAGLGRLPVVSPLEPDRVVGILSRSDVLRALSRHSDEAPFPERHRKVA